MNRMSPFIGPKNHPGFSSLTIFFFATILASFSADSQADSLKDIYELALKNDPKLQSAEATYRANVEPEKQARAQLLPQLNAEGSYGGSRRLQDSSQAVFKNNAIVNGDIGVQQTIRQGAWGVSLSQPIFDLSAWYSFKSSRAQSAQAAAQFAADQQDLIVRCADAYFNVLRQFDNVQASKAEESATAEQLESAEQRYKWGTAAVTDVYQARAAYKTSVAQRIADEGNLAAAYEYLTILTGQHHTNVSLLKENFPVSKPNPSGSSAWVQFALVNNYSLKAAGAAVDAANQNATSKSAAQMPKISGSLNYQETNISGSQTTTPSSPFATPPGLENHVTSATINITAPLFSSGYTSSQARQAHEQYNAALDQKIEVERTIIQNTQAKHIATSNDVQEIEARAEAIDAAQNAVTATNAGYKAGTRSIVDVLLAQRALFSALRDHAKSRYAYIMDMLKLKQLAGTLSPKDIDDLNGWIAEPNPSSSVSFFNAADDHRNP
jgi:outer membrane protein